MKRKPKQYFRACVGAVITRGDQVLVFERKRHPGSWQFPQGGLEADEEPEDAAWREVLEETGLTRDKLALLFRHPEVLTYELPAAWRSKKTGLGQSQYWFYFQLLGEESDIAPDEREFSAAKWVSMREAVKDAVDFRRPVYQRVRAYLPAALSRIPDAAPLGPVTLRPIEDEAALLAMFRLQVSPDQRGFVADNAMSIAEALLEPKSWLRSIYAGDTAVGLILLSDDPAKPEYYLWRMLIGARYQRRGYGRAAMQQLIDYVRTRPAAAELLVSYVPGEGGPQGFYEGLGFVPTGEVDAGEVVMKLPL